MSARPASSDDQPVPRRARRDRHRVRLEPTTPRAPTAPGGLAERAEVAPRAPRRVAPVAPGDGLYAPSAAGVSRPVQLSDRCAGCGAPTRGRANMVTEVVDVGPVRALRVVACSACPDRRGPQGPVAPGV